jgi:hypothetical protein
MVWKQAMIITSQLPVAQLLNRLQDSLIPSHHTEFKPVLDLFPAGNDGFK